MGQTMLLDLMEAKFGEVSPEVREAVQSIEDAQPTRPVRNLELRPLNRRTPGPFMSSRAFAVSWSKSPDAHFPFPT
jgi:hypothetical protein